MNKIKVGFLPLYIKLYDDAGLDRSDMQNCMDTAVSMLQSEGIEVVSTDVCRIKPEFDVAAAAFNEADVDAVVTFHFAYSPSLESIDALCSLNAPIIVCDTTVTYNMSERMNSDDIMPNHGIHGVMDMCNLLKRAGKPYFVEAGHITESDVIARCAGHCRAAKAAKAFGQSRIGSMGGSFVGMGDFLRSDADMKTDFGADIIYFDFDKDYDKYLAQVSDDNIDKEIANDAARFLVEVQNMDNYRAQTQMGLVLRAWATANNLSAYSVNFLAMTQAKMPFLEISKAMMNGMGYAGEGDVLTAGLVGALMSAYDGVTFTETFCPCWKNNLILMSHMGEMNMNVAAQKAIVTDKPFPYTQAGDTVAAFGTLRAGKAVFINLAPMDNGKYTLIVSPVEMVDVKDNEDSYRSTTEGWMKPQLPLIEYLKAYSEIGGTHHSALVYDVSVFEIISFGQIMGFDVEVL
jgi:L-arabinose isomerase